MADPGPDFGSDQLAELLSHFIPLNHCFCLRFAMRPTLVNNLRVLVPVKRTIDYVRQNRLERAKTFAADIVLASHRLSRLESPRMAKV